MSAQENQIALFNITDAPDPRDAYFKTLDILSYDHYLVMHSGGKDSVSSFLWLLEQGVPRSKIEIFHHRVDGAPDEPRVFDWPVTDAYMRANPQAGIACAAGASALLRLTLLASVAALAPTASSPTRTNWPPSARSTRAASTRWPALKKPSLTQ